MSIPGAISYNLKTNVIGKAALRYERLRAEWKMKKPHEKQNPNWAH